MELRHFRYFIGVAEELSFSRAARRLNVSQPPLTQAIQQLEEELEVRLFERTSRKVELTEAGTVFLSRARGILAQINRATMELRSQGKAKKEVLRVGFTRTMSVLPEAMKKFRQRFPDVHLELLPSVDRPSRDFLIDDEADLNIGEYQLPDEQLDSRLWAEMKFMAILPSSHPLADRDQIGIRDLRDQPLLLPGLAKTVHMGREALRFCRETGGFEPQSLRHCDDIDVFLSLIASEAGVGIIHGFYLNKESKDPSGEISAPFWKSVPFRERTPLLKIGIVWRRDRESAALFGLIEELEAKIRPLAKTDIPGSIHYLRKNLARSR